MPSSASRHSSSWSADRICCSAGDCAARVSRRSGTRDLGLRTTDMSTTLIPDNRRGLTLRLTALQYVVAAAFAALGVGFWVFQIAQHDKFLEMAENNRLRKVPLPAPRGVIMDREGRVLVDNQSTFSIVLDREQTKNIPEVLRT